jgi:hypothetical protein
MTTDDIIKMAREAGFADDKGVVHPAYQLEAFANLVAAHKAEVALAEAYRCGYKDGMESAAVVCKNLAEQQDKDVRDECAAAIRTRGELK